MGDRILTKTIPAEFIRLDGSCTDADDYLDVRLLQTIKANHNILMARRHRKQISYWQSNLANGALTHKSVSLPDAETGDVIWHQALLVEPHIKAVELTVYANAGATGIELWPVIGNATLPTDDNKISILVASTEYNVTLPIPPGARSADGRYVELFIFLSMDAGTTGKTDSGPHIINAWGSSAGTGWFEDASSPTTAAVGGVVVFSDTEIEPRTVAAVDGSRVFLDGTFTKGPINGTTTATHYVGSTITIEALGTYEAALTDFSAEVTTT